MDFSVFFSEVLKQYGLHTALFVVIFLYVLKDIWKKILKRLFGKKPIALKDHVAFKELDHIIIHSIANDFKCECPIRKELYRDILMRRMTCFRDRLLEFVQTDLDNKTLYPTQHDFYLKITNVIDEASAEAKAKCIADGIPEFVLETIEEHRKQIRVIMGDMLKSICHAEYPYASNRERMQQILPFIVVFCKNYMYMLEGLLASYNGEIRKLEYKGTRCKGCKVCIHDEYVRRMKQALAK